MLRITSNIQSTLPTTHPQILRKSTHNFRSFTIKKQRERNGSENRGKAKSDMAMMYTEWPKK